MRRTASKFRLSQEQLAALGARIAYRREQQSWSQRELARRARVDASRLSKIEHGQTAPTLDELAAMSLVLRACLDELVWGDAPDLARLVHCFAGLTGSQERELLSRVLQALSSALAGPRLPEARPR